MKKPKRKLTAEQKRQKRERQKKYMFIFVNGRQKRVKRPETIEGCRSMSLSEETPTRSGCIRMKCGSTWKTWSSE